MICLFVINARIRLLRFASTTNEMTKYKQHSFSPLHICKASNTVCLSWLTVSTVCIELTPCSKQRIAADVGFSGLAKPMVQNKFMNLAANHTHETQTCIQQLSRRIWVAGRELQDMPDTAPEKAELWDRQEIRLMRYRTCFIVCNVMPRLIWDTDRGHQRGS